MKTVKKLKWIFINISFAMMILGLCLMIWPHISMKVMCYLFGALILITGIVRIVCYTRRGVCSFFHYYEFPLGLLDILLAAFILSLPQHVILVLPVVMGIMVLIDSIFKLQLAIDLKRIGLRSWWSVLLLSVFSILIFIFFMLYLFKGVVTLTVFIGISMILDSIQSLYSIIYASGYVKKHVRKKEPIDADYIEVE